MQFPVLFLSYNPNNSLWLLTSVEMKNKMYKCKISSTFMTIIYLLQSPDIRYKNSIHLISKG